MEIEINKTASEFILHTNKIRWTLYKQRLMFSLLLVFVCGVIFSFAGRSQGYDSSESDYKYNKNFTVSYVHTTQYNYHVMLGLGIAFMLFSIYLAFVYLILQKKKFFKVVNKVANRHKKVSDIYTLKITDDGIFYKDSEIMRDEKWVVFSKYKMNKNNLMLFRDDFYINALVIDKRQLSDGDFNELLIFVKKILPEKGFLK
jgi:hypothetical protein